MKGSRNLTSKIISFIVTISLLLLVGCNNKEVTKVTENENPSNPQYFRNFKYSNETTTLVFQNVNLITMTEDNVLENYSVVVKDGLIAEIGKSETIAVPKGAQVIKGDGKYLMPGLVDMHVHLWRYRGEEILYLANGVTTIQNMWGYPLHLSMKRDVNARRVLSPRIFTTGPIMDGPNPVWEGSVVLDTPEKARREVISVKERGYDTVKIYEYLTVEVYEEIMKTAREIDIRVVGHVPVPVGLRLALEMGQS